MCLYGLKCKQGAGVYRTINCQQLPTIIPFFFAPLGTSIGAGGQWSATTKNNSCKLVPLACPLSTLLGCRIDNYIYIYIYII